MLNEKGCVCVTVKTMKQNFTKLRLKWEHLFLFTFELEELINMNSFLFENFFNYFLGSPCCCVLSCSTASCTGRLTTTLLELVEPILSESCSGTIGLLFLVVSWIKLPLSSFPESSSFFSSFLSLSIESPVFSMLFFSNLGTLASGTPLIRHDRFWT